MESSHHMVRLLVKEEGQDEDEGEEQDGDG